MDYCHEYYFKEDIKEFDNKLIEKVGRVLDSFYKKNLISLSFISKEKPIVNSNEIRFNGRGGNGCENFVITPQTLEYSFTKTNLRKYDIVVCIVLLLLKIHYSDEFHFSSDGFFIEVQDNWFKAVKYVNKLHKKTRVKFIVKDNKVDTIQVFQ